MGVKVRLPPDKTGSNMCSGCTVRCCSLQIDLTIYDIVRIAAVGKPVASFLAFVDAKETDPFAFRAYGKMVKFVLLKRRDGLCVFFDGRRGLYCAIEESKPSSCLAYPMALDASGRVFVRKDVLCPSKNLARADFSKMSKSVLEDYVWELDRHAEFAADWNRSARGDEPPERFLAFASSEAELESTAWGRIIRRAKRRFRRLRT